MATKRSTKKNDDIVVTLAVHEIHMLLDVLEGMRRDQSGRPNDDDDLMDCAAYAESLALIAIYATTESKLWMAHGRYTRIHE